jgi:hypothetical protein
MLDILQQYLDENATAECSIVIKDSVQLFEDLTLPDYEEKYEQLIMQNDSLDSGSVLLGIHDITLDLVTQILNEHGLFLVEETPLAIANKFLRAIIEIQVYDNPEDVNNVCLLDDSETVVISELFSLVSEMPVDEMLIHIDRVDASLITRIGELAVLWEGENLDTDNIELAKQLVLKLKAFTRFIMSSNLMAVNLLTNGGSAGFPFSFYLDLIGREVEMLKPEYAAKELVAMALISSDGHVLPQIAIRTHIEKYMADSLRVALVDIEVGKLVLGLSK